jgi:hypothetical protein
LLYFVQLSVSLYVFVRRCHPPNQSAAMFVVTLSRRQVGRSGRFRGSRKSQVETSMWEHGDPVHEGSRDVEHSQG